VPYVLPQPQETVASGAPLRIKTFNIHGGKSERGAFLDYVQTEQPDVILLTELPPLTDWLGDSLGADYRYRLGGTLGTPHDLLLFSRWPIVNSRIDRSVNRGSPVIAADLCREEVGAGACVRLVGLHAIAPFARFARLHTAQLELAARMATAAPDGQAILAGDLNMTPWSPTFQRLLAESGLRDAALGRSITATWLSRQPMVGIAIDHVLASPRIAVRAYDVGLDLGSDHLPVVATMAVPQTPPATIGESR
jgi:endonuclease/exonuclease/phosphatase (EEP) superfamily protein YafD